VEVRRAAYLLRGNWHDDEDLTQTALTTAVAAEGRVAAGARGRGPATSGGEST
jgi:hypothetical protein